MDVSEADHYETGEAAKHSPSLVLNHVGGYLLASGIMAALCHRATVGGSQAVSGRKMKYLRSLSQYPDRSGSEAPDFEKVADVDEYMETHTSTFGELRAVRYSATMQGCSTSWEFMPEPLESDKPEWLV